MFEGLSISVGRPMTKVRAWTYMGVNLLATPGLGTWWGGRKAAGAGQLLFSVTGFFLIVGWMFKGILGNAMDEINGLEPTPVPAIWLRAGLVAFGISWVWSLVSSISMVIEASANGDRPGMGAPPVLARPSKSSPPLLAAAFPLRALDGIQISQALLTVPAWRREGDSIVRFYQFADFAAAMAFVNKVAQLAEDAGHYPDIDIRWNRVTLALSTHDIGGLTERDFALARMFDRLD